MLAISKYISKTMGSCASKTPENEEPIIGDDNIEIPSPQTKKINLKEKYKFDPNIQPQQEVESTSSINYINTNKPNKPNKPNKHNLKLELKECENNNPNTNNNKHNLKINTNSNQNSSKNTNIKQNTKDNTKWENHKTKILTSRGALETPTGFKWFPTGHGHKKVKKLFKFKSEIGHGVTGVVYSAVYNGKKCAIKKIERENQWGKMLFTTEARVLRNLKHPGIIELIDLYFDEQYFYLVMERAHYDLYYMMQGQGHLSEKKASVITKNLLNAIKYMHSKNIAHRDLKPENIVFSKHDPTLPKCIDFGDAELVRDEKIYTEFVGTPPYMSPERLSEHKGWQLKKSDVWAIGVICFEMITGRRCFRGKTQESVFRKVSKGHWNWPKDFLPSEQCQDFIRWCLQLDAKDRPSCEEALTHPFITGEKDTPLKSPNYGNKSTIISTNIMSSSAVLSKFNDMASLVSSTRLQQILLHGIRNQLSEEDKKQFTQEFNELDKNNDGFVDFTDLVNSFSSDGIPPNQAASFASIIINELDTTNQKKISLEIFMEARIQDALNKSCSNMSQVFLGIIESSCPDFVDTSMDITDMINESEDIINIGISDEPENELIMCQNDYSGTLTPPQPDIDEMVVAAMTHRASVPFDQKFNINTLARDSNHTMHSVNSMHSIHSIHSSIVDSVSKLNLTSYSSSTFKLKKEEEKETNSDEEISYHSQKNNFITVDNLTTFSRINGSPIDDDELTSMFSSFDTDGDGKLSFPEFVAAMRSHCTMKSKIRDASISPVAPSKGSYDLLNSLASESSTKRKHMHKRMKKTNPIKPSLPTIIQSPPTSQRQPTPSPPPVQLKSGDDEYNTGFETGDTHSEGAGMSERQSSDYSSL